MYLNIEPESRTKLFTFFRTRVFLMIKQSISDEFEDSVVIRRIFEAADIGKIIPIIIFDCSKVIFDEI